MRISLCIVARNEAPFIGGAIESARPVVDEVVVVDTGSSDGTPDIARSAGARVFEVEQLGDMATAHGLPVARARGEWVLALDADEVLDPGLREGVRELAASGEYDAYALPIMNYQYSWCPKWRPVDPAHPLSKGAPGFIPSQPVRLFRRGAEYVYRGQLHQTLYASILEGGGRIGRADIPIHHYGYLRVDRDKSELYLTLSTRHARESPDDLFGWIDLGILLANDGRPAAAADAFRRARALGNRNDASFHLGCILLGLERPAAAAALLREAIRHNPDDESAFYDRADALEALGLAYEENGRQDAAVRAYRSALRLRPCSPGAAINLAALLGARGEYPDAELLLGELVTAYPGSATAWSAAGLLELRRRRLDAAETALARAVELDSSNVWALLNLGLTHLRAGRPRKAAQTYAAAREWLAEGGGRRELAASIPRRYRTGARARVPNHEPGLVVGVIQRLEGGAGRVFVDGLLALENRPRLAVCCETSIFSGLGLRDELEAAGVETLAVASASLGTVLARLRPAVVLHHYWRQSYLRGALRVGDERWICVGHVALPMPLGYDGYVAVSEYHRCFQGHLPSDRIRVVPNGVDLARFGGQRPGGRRRVTIAMVSRLEPTKVPRRLLDYLPPLERAQVLVAGIGGRRYELEPELRERGLVDRVRFLGSISSARIPEFLASADIGLHVTELSEEVWGMSVHEMLAAGLPVVAEPKGNLPDLVVPGRNGFLADDAAEVAARLHELVENPQLRRRMGAESCRLARRYDIRTFGSRLRRFVAEVEHRESSLPGGPADLPFRPSGKRRRRRPTWRPHLSVLVCATLRSGSTLLCEALAGSGLVGDAAEYFQTGMLRTMAGRSGVADVEHYLAYLFERTSTPNGVFSMKLMPDARVRLLDGLRALPGGEARTDPELIADAFPAVRYVSIIRRDTLRQAVSRERANQTDQWAKRATALSVAPPRPRFNRAAITRTLRLIHEEEAEWRAFFAAAGAQPVRVEYEDLVADYEGTARRVLGELGIDLPRDLVFEPRQLQRQADETSERWVRRYTYGTSAARRARTPAHTTAAS